MSTPWHWIRKSAVWSWDFKTKIYVKTNFSHKQANWSETQTMLNISSGVSYVKNKPFVTTEMSMIRCPFISSCVKTGSSHQNPEEKNQFTFMKEGSIDPAACQEEVSRNKKLHSHVCRTHCINTCFMFWQIYIWANVCRWLEQREKNINSFFRGAMKITKICLQFKFDCLSAENFFFCFTWDCIRKPQKKKYIIVKRKNIQFFFLKQKSEKWSIHNAPIGSTPFNKVPGS